MTGINRASSVGDKWGGRNSLILHSLSEVVHGKVAGSKVRVEYKSYLPKKASLISVPEGVDKTGRDEVATQRPWWARRMMVPLNISLEATDVKVICMGEVKCYLDI